MPAVKPQAPRLRPAQELLVVLGMGGALLVGGWLMARRALPEWRQATLPERSRVEAAFADVLRAGALTPVDGAPRARVAADARGIEHAYAHLGAQAGTWLATDACALQLEVSQRVTDRAPGGGTSLMTVQMCGNLQLRLVQSMADNWFQTAGRPFLDAPVRDTVRRLLVPDESAVGEPRQVVVGNSEGKVFPLRQGSGSSPEYLQVVSFPGPGAAAMRLPGTVDQAVARNEAFSWSGLLLEILPSILLVLGVGVLFVALLIRRRVDFVNALWLAVLCLLGTAGGLSQSASVGGLLSAAGLVVVWLGRALLLFILWATAESWLRATLPGFTTSLDAVRAGQLGPRAGRAILGGWGVGAGAAGFHLLLFSVAGFSALVRPKELSAAIGVWAGSSPFYVGTLRAGLVVLSVAAARRILPARWAPAGAVALAGLLQVMPAIDPWPMRLGGSLLLAALLVFAHQKFGLTSLLVAALNSECLPSALLGAQQPAWLWGAVAQAAGASVGLLLLGTAARSLRADPAGERAAVPRFVRRLEDERRMRYEMDLLARMQQGLLPATLPTVDGWSIAARSLLANEVGGDLYDFVWDEHGRLWIAAGDVSGHGFSCAITQAMTKAALVSLVYSGTTPAEVLGEMDRVLRTAGDVRNFASLALLRLDPATGEGRLANAGHPYPLLRGAGGVRELVLPGLPLGRGPERTYRDVEVTLAPGDTLVFASDGLFEALGPASEEPYGFERVGVVLGAGLRTGAEEVVEHLLADWTRFRAGQPATDDTTLVVLRRAPTS